MSTGNNNVEALRDSLFDTMAKLKDGKIDVATAKAAADLGQTIINTAKVEIDFARVTKTDVGSTFITRRITALPVPGAPPSAPAQLVDATQPEPDLVEKPAPQQGQAGTIMGTVQRFTAEDTNLPNGIVGVTRHSMQS